MRILISAGEVSGDMVAARVAERLLARDASLRLFGLGGPRMAAVGVEVDLAARQLGTVGVSEALTAAPSLVGVLRRLRHRFRTEKPDVALLVGNDAFNTFFARWLRGRGVPTVSLFPPQVWVWRAVATYVAHSFDLVLTSFPEEQEVYERASAGTNARAEFVGHYLAEVLAPPTRGEVAESRARLGLEPSTRTVGLLPGSRIHEVRRLTGPLLDAAHALLARDPSVQFVIPPASPELRGHVEGEVRRRALSSRVAFTDDSLTAMRAADVLLLASGTASLEATLLGIPMVVAYVVSPVTSLTLRTAIRLRLIRGETVALPNLIIGREVVPELRQAQVSGAAFTREAWPLLSEPLRAETMRRALAGVAEKLSFPGTLERVVGAILTLGGATRDASDSQTRAATGREGR